MLLLPEAAEPAEPAARGTPMQSGDERRVVTVLPPSLLLASTPQSKLRHCLWPCNGLCLGKHDLLRPGEGLAFPACHRSFKSGRLALRT